MVTGIEIGHATQIRWNARVDGWHHRSANGRSADGRSANGRSAHGRLANGLSANGRSAHNGLSANTDLTDQLSADGKEYIPDHRQRISVHSTAVANPEVRMRRQRRGSGSGGRTIGRRRGGQPALEDRLFRSEELLVREVVVISARGRCRSAHEFTLSMIAAEANLIYLLPRSARRRVPADSSRFSAVQSRPRRPPRP